LILIIILKTFEPISIKWQGRRRLRLSITTVGVLWLSALLYFGQPVLEGMQERENPFEKESKIDHKITSDDVRGFAN